MIQSKVFISDCRIFFDAIGTFTQAIAGWIALTGKNVAQISDGISNPVFAGIIYWLIRILICGGCLVGVGILLAFIGVKIAEVLLGYDYHIGNTYKHGNSNLFRRLDKDNIDSQSIVSLVIGTGNICRDKMVCERLAGNKGISLT